MFSCLKYNIPYYTMRILHRIPYLVVNQVSCATNQVANNTELFISDAKSLNFISTTRTDGQSPAQAEGPTWCQPDHNGGIGEGWSG